MSIEEQRRAGFELAVIERMKESGFLEVEIRVECLTRMDDGYLDSSIDAYWHFWNAALDSAVIGLSSLRLSSRPGFIGSERVYVSDVIELCEAAGLKVKP
ncbi:MULTISPECIES: hypothetical protein [unclassified Pseudomonas]|uniref:hypothetical protein n=1 Tax=unclassified Pseudomonas TaxID=196821 RepID=UPI00244D3253|nr:MULTISPECIES: hypothetical protein [unclassified Pseudomonas]MDG9927448.1 hypothetical protein [Pseudomonas sp. GD04042]MDH0482517.1 hypothetical protein [Pseudomonas sp. GD04015]MDH0602869.1 hypothetical protein [Pseudomonas sp. GD03869]